MQLEKQLAVLSAGSWRSHVEPARRLALAASSYGGTWKRSFGEAKSSAAKTSHRAERCWKESHPKIASRIGPAGERRFRVPPYEALACGAGPAGCPQKL